MASKVCPLICGEHVRWAPRCCGNLAVSDSQKVSSSRDSRECATDHSSSRMLHSSSSPPLVGVKGLTTPEQCCRNGSIGRKWDSTERSPLNVGRRSLPTNLSVSQKCRTTSSLRTHAPHPFRFDLRIHTSSVVAAPSLHTAQSASFHFHFLWDCTDSSPVLRLVS